MLLDNNILLDFVLNRPPDPLAARELIHRIETTATTAFVAWHSIATCYYIVQRDIDRTTARNFIERLAGLLTVAPTSQESLLYALSLPMADFEDAMQVAAARAAGVGHIVTRDARTRDARDFENSPIPTITPEQAILELS